jgi:phosphatidylglycerol---prolipoprotein diacylglyceryl transferase
MFPVLFHIPGIHYDLPGYGVAMMAAFLLSIMWAARRAMRSGADPDVILNLGFVALIGGVLGARSMYVWHYWDQFANRGTAMQVFWAVIDVRKGGLEVYGGFICVVAAVLFYLWVSKHSVRWYLDIVAPSAALGMSIGRIGCFLNGCCWGVATHDVPWAVQFPFGSPAAVQQWTEHVPGAELPEQLLIVVGRDGTTLPLMREALRATPEQLDAARAKFEGVTAELRARLEQTSEPEARWALREQMIQEAGHALPSTPQYLAFAAEQMNKYNLSGADLLRLARTHPSLPVHPTQIYSVIALGLLALFLNALYWRRKFDGQVICMLLFIEPPTRFVLERLRADNPVDVGVFTISQFLSLCLSAIGLIGLIWLSRKPKRSPRAVIWEPPPEPAPAKAAAK